MHKVVSSSGSHCWCQPFQETDQLQMWQILFTLFVSLVRGKGILVGHHNIGVINQYSHILQTQSRFIIQISKPYRVTLCHTMSHCHCTGKQPQLKLSWQCDITFIHWGQKRLWEGGRDTLRERDIERDTEKDRVRERMRKRERGMEWDRGGRERGREGEREREKERERECERARERESESERARERESERDRQRDREREKDKDRDRERQADRNTERDRQRQRLVCCQLTMGFSVHLFLRLSVEEWKHSLRLLLVYTPCVKHFSLINTHFYHTYLLCTTTLT